MNTQDGKKQVVVVGVDGSAESVAALSWAAQYGAATGAAIRALQAWHYPTAASIAPVGIAPPEITQDVRTRIEEGLAATVAKVYTGTLPDGVQMSITYGHPVEALVEASQTADLLVVGSRGHGAFTGMMLGSVSIHCVTSAHCPVVVVRGDG